MSEQWVLVNGVPDYEVSSEGRVRRRDTGRILKLTPNWRKRGEGAYLRVSVGRRPGAKQRQESRHVHKLVAEHFLPPRPSPAHMVRHLDDDWRNNRAVNLAWGTAQDNTDDKIRNGRMRRGETAGGRVRHSAALVAQIRAFTPNTEFPTVSDFAKSIGVPRQTCYNIRRGDCRKWG